MTPEVAVISYGVDNQYGHPHNTTLSILTDYGVNVYSTDDGHKKFTTDKEESTVKK